MTRPRLTLKRTLIALALMALAAVPFVEAWKARRDALATARHAASAEGFRRLRDDWEFSRREALEHEIMVDYALSRLRNPPQAVAESVAFDPGGDDGAVGLDPEARLKSVAADDRKRAAKASRKAAYFEAMRQKYALAAQHPRLPVAPDPPEPK